MATILKIGNIHLHNSSNTGTPFDGTGTPWTAADTTPFSLANNDVTGEKWTPALAPTAAVYGGGPPFRSGRNLVYRSYDNANEPIPIQIYATNEDNAFNALQVLRHEFKRALFDRTPVLEFRLDGATNAVYYEVHDGDIVENPLFVNDEHGRGLLRVVFQLVRSPFGGKTTLDTLLNNITVVNNTSSGTNQNIRSLGTLDGDLIYEGQPLNIRVTPDSGASFDVLYLASALSRDFTTDVSGLKSTSDTDDGINFADNRNDNVNIPANQGVKLASFIRVTTGTTNAQLRATLRTVAGTISKIQDGKWISLQATGTQWIFLGVFDLNALRLATPESQQVGVDVFLRSSNGALASATPDIVESVFCYDICKLTPSETINTTSSKFVQIEQAQNMNGTAWLPRFPRIAYNGRVVLSERTLVKQAVVSGTLPRAYRGASLWMSWSDANGTVDITDTATVLVEHAPLYRTSRGTS